MVMDKGLSVREAEDFVSVNADHTDLMKLGFGSAFVTPNLDKKIKVYRDAGLHVYFGGTLLEAFIVRKQFDDYLRLLEKYKMTHAELSDGSISIPQPIKNRAGLVKLVSMLPLVSEVGSKEEGIIIHPNRWIEMMEKELKAGMEGVIAESRESGNCWHLSSKWESARGTD